MTQPTCPECAGTGYVATCPVCRGATTVIDETLGGASIACEFCDATGQVPSGLATDPGRQPCGHCCDKPAFDPSREAEPTATGACAALHLTPSAREAQP
jgi:RecJ-like exonuclease